MRTPILLYEYLAVIKPDTPVLSETLNMKRLCKTDHGWPTPIKSQPHITLSNFVQPLFIEEKLINNYRRLAASISSFDIYLLGFGHFSGPSYTIYVNIQNEERISEIAKYIKRFSKSILKPVKNYTPHYTNKPHLTIAKGISESDFLKAWPAWKIKDYHAVSLATGIQLLRRPLSSVWEKYEKAGFFPFTGLIPLDSQLELF